ncbi:ParA family protein [Corynebacterium macginleyi]|uniref:ParA family protein n=1 Tax=Corynebacterium macginleyi TaxID=38290 RepID=UPI002D804E47|nr:ParA family protein [Corynebacterium macginleyi]
MTRVISVIQSKGGTGKTTLSVMLAEAIRRMGYTVAVADGDPQQSATRWATKVKDFPFPIESVRSSSDFSGVVRRGEQSGLSYSRYPSRWFMRLPSFSGHPISTDPVSVGEDVHCEFVKEEVHPGVPA